MVLLDTTDRRCGAEECGFDDRSLDVDGTGAAIRGPGDHLADLVRVASEKTAWEEHDERQQRFAGLARLSTIQRLFGTLAIVSNPVKRLGVVRSSVGRDGCDIDDDCFAVAQVDANVGTAAVARRVGALVRAAMQMPVGERHRDVTGVACDDAVVGRLALAVHVSLSQMVERVRDLRMGDGDVVSLATSAADRVRAQVVEIGEVGVVVAAAAREQLIGHESMR